MFRREEQRPLLELSQNFRKIMKEAWAAVGTLAMVWFEIYIRSDFSLSFLRYIKRTFGCYSLEKNKRSSYGKAKVFSE